MWTSAATPQLSRFGVVPTPDFATFPRSAPSRARAPAQEPSQGISQQQPSSQQQQQQPGGQQQGPVDVLVVATDGLWEVVENQEAVEVAAGAGSPQEGARLLVQAAQQRWAEQFGGGDCDDITVAVAFLS